MRSKIIGTSEVPRLCVFRSNKYTYAQVIDDSKGATLISVTMEDIKKESKRKSKDAHGKSEVARGIGKLVAEKAMGKKIEKVVFDRGGYKYHGRVKALAEGAREGGLKF